MDVKKKYINPEADVVELANEDIITLSLGTQNGNWELDDNTEDMN